MKHEKYKIQMKIQGIQWGMRESGFPGPYDEELSLNLKI